MTTAAYLISTLLIAGLALLIRFRHMLWYAKNVGGPQSLYARVEKVLEASGIGRPDEPGFDRLVMDAEREFRIGLVEHDLDPAGYRIEFRHDELIGLVPWVVEPSGQTSELSAFAATRAK